MSDDDGTRTRRDDAESDRTRTVGETEAGFRIADGNRIGPYRFVRKLGEGGMGAVFEALQERPLRRRVALKLIKVGMDTERLIARFELERQTLASLNHPAIAKVYDAGATETGRPYFAMEYVDGLPLVRYCDEKRLDVDARLDLFVRVCEGVQHAHQKGILHRDLKPSNVLVEEVDGRPGPKIIDFGIARATQTGDDGPGLTVAGEFVGTPAYMSPEQAVSRDDVDTRTDVYSLGVMLYELVTGSLPIDPRTIRERGLEEMLRALREDPPERPSHRITTIGARRAEIAELRHTDPSHLRRELRGDLDWIVLRALEKDRERRYPSVSELAADIGRHRRHEPVLAGPPSVVYRTKKFVRRHRIGVAAATLVVLSLVGGIVASTSAMIRARRAEREARIEAQTATRVSDFLVELFDVVDPGTARGNTVTAREILDRGVERIHDDLGDEPEIRAKLLETMGRVYRSLSLFDEARPLLEEAVTVRETLPGGSPLETGRVLMVLSGLLFKLGNLEEALASAERARSLFEEAGPAGRGEIPRIWTNLGAIHLAAGRVEAGRAALLLALESAENEYGPHDPEVAKNLINLGALERRAGNLDESVAYYGRALEIALATRGEVHPETAAALNNLGNAQKRKGDLGEARRALERALAIQKRLYAEDHADLASAMNSLAEVCGLAGDLECALGNARAALEMRERIFGPAQRETLRSARTLEDALLAAGRAAEAGALRARYDLGN